MVCTWQGWLAYAVWHMPFEERARRAGTIAAIMEKAAKRLHEYVRMQKRLHEPRIVHIMCSQM
ncbi:hypothetical protein HaLaN_07965 [Haematococcus lacustris]|uniref:Uncharacterized protein n=1 Tax=Haematococcus lacustris TaxID=44745 RepID=A0A699YXR1_HAELA|nr:hypothetical protein HaLaN_07965 [Haematococcus lacustris]